MYRYVQYYMFIFLGSHGKSKGCVENFENFIAWFSLV